MGWFKRIQEGITTSTNEKKETPEGLWYQCPKCKHITSTEEHEHNLHVCIKCNFHERINAKEYLSFVIPAYNKSLVQWADYSNSKSAVTVCTFTQIHKQIHRAIAFNAT